MPLKKTSDSINHRAPLDKYEFILFVEGSIYVALRTPAILCRCLHRAHFIHSFLYIMLHMFFDGKFRKSFCLPGPLFLLRHPLYHEDILAAGVVFFKKC